MEIKMLTDKIRTVAGKICDHKPLADGEANLAKNLLNEYADSLELRSTKASAVEKSADAEKVRNREKMLRYRTKRRLSELMENK